MAKYYVNGYMTNNSQRITVSATVEADSEFVAIELAKSKIRQSKPNYKDWSIEILSIRRI
ncbi:TPA: hypothetical protein ACU8BO_000726 [Neisseria subflava]|uniref:hypothetical protein n=1 Tax=Neisseria subflava TaxID=28449 RepID=UPI000A641B6F|nr:hypothetical protein [Neisseria subflava]